MSPGPLADLRLHCPHQHSEELVTWTGGQTRGSDRVCSGPQRAGLALVPPNANNGSTTLSGVEAEANWLPSPLLVHSFFEGSRVGRCSSGLQPTPLRLWWHWSGVGACAWLALCFPGILRPPLTGGPRAGPACIFLRIPSGHSSQPPLFLQTDSSYNQVSLPLLSACSAEPDQLPLMVSPPGPLCGAGVGEGN